MNGVMRLLLLLALAGGVFWLTSLSSLAGNIPPWVQAIAWVGPLLLAPFIEDAAKDKLKESWKGGMAWLYNSLFTFDLLVKASVPATNSIASIFSQAESYLTRKGFEWSIGMQNKNVRQYKVNQPPVTLLVRITPEFRDDNEAEVPCSLIEITGVEPQIVSYRERKGAQVETVVSMMYDLANEIYHSVPGGSEPQILLTVNRLKGRQSSRRPHPPATMETEQVGGGVSVRKDGTALQVFASSTSGVLRELQRDIGQLDPVA